MKFNKKRLEERSLDSSIMPASLDKFIGNTDTVEQLMVMINASKKRGEPLGHIIFHGPPGLGKTTLANLVSKEVGTSIFKTSGPAIKRPGDLAGILTNLSKGDILFIDEIHTLPRHVEEYLYPAMDSLNIDLIIDSGQSAKTLSLSIKNFTLIGATTKLSSVTSPLRSRFLRNLHISFYDEESLKRIVITSAKMLSLKIDEDGAISIARRSRGTPRIANNLLRWVRDYSEVNSNGTISLELVNKACEMVGLDDSGLSSLDKKILSIIAYNENPIGIKSIAASLGEEEKTLLEVYEPYLVLKGFVRRTSRGREITSSGKDIIKREI